MLNNFVVKTEKLGLPVVSFYIENFSFEEMVKLENFPIFLAFLR